jgi:hypothetical protein
MDVRIDHDSVYQADNVARKIIGDCPVNHPTRFKVFNSLQQRCEICFSYLSYDFQHLLGQLVFFLIFNQHCQK